MDHERMHRKQEPNGRAGGRKVAAACRCENAHSHAGSGRTTEAAFPVAVSKPLSSRRGRGRARMGAAVFMGLSINTINICLLAAQVSGQIEAANDAAENLNANLGPLNIFLQGFAESFAKPVKGMLPTSLFYTPGFSHTVCQPVPAAPSYASCEPECQPKSLLTPGRASTPRECWRTDQQVGDQ